MRPLFPLLALSLLTQGCSSSGPSQDTAPADAAAAADASTSDAADVVDAPGDTLEPTDVSTDATADAAAEDVHNLPDAPDDASDSTDEDANAVWPDAHCNEVVAGHNADDPGRINLVLLYAGFDSPTTPMDIPKLFRALVGGTSENDYAFDPNLAPLYAVEGLSGIEPFSSNFDRFNFWWVDLPLYGSGDICPALELPPGTSCLGNVLTTTDGSGNTTQRVLSPQDILDLSPAGRACALPHKLVNLVYSPTSVMSESSFPMPGNYAVFDAYSQEVLTFGATTSVSMVFQNFVHEFVHSVGQVWDEKGNGLSSADYPAPISGPNCFSLGPSTPLTPSTCAASAQLPWHDLIGNGCGQDGVVDCPITRSYHDPNTNQDMVDRFDEWLYELRDDVDGCGQGCLYTQGNVFRPHQGCNVMSSCDLTAEIHTGLFTRLGPVNEREVCRRVLAITGGVSAWCETLCLAGCPFGTRCVQGVCKDKSSL